MADLREMLARLLAGEQEQPNLSPTAPSAAPHSLLRNRPHGRPAGGYGDVAPLPPQWAERGPQTLSAPPQQTNPFPFPMGTPEPPPVPVAPMGHAARVGISDQNSPASFGNFADYANTTMGLQQAQAPAAQAPEPWTQPTGTGTWAAGRPSIGRGMEPPSAPQRPRETDIENAAWTAALERTRSRMRFEGEREMRRMPRPGQPLIAQAWADQGGLMGGLAGVEGDRLNPNRGNSRDRR